MEDWCQSRFNGASPIGDNMALGAPCLHRRQGQGARGPNGMATTITFFSYVLLPCPLDDERSLLKLVPNTRAILAAESQSDGEL